jgi:hypothetical protein
MRYSGLIGCLRYKIPYAAFCAIGAILTAVLFAPAGFADVIIHVAPDATPGGDGSAGAPLSISAAQERVRSLPKSTRTGRIDVVLSSGVYALESPLVFGDGDSGSPQCPVIWRAADSGARVTLSGGRALRGLAWQPWRDGIWRAQVASAPDTPAEFDQLFVNGERQTLARYPDYSPRATYLNGIAADVDSPGRVARWKNPAGGFIHALHKGMWGGFHYRITGGNPDGSLALSGGWQNNRGEHGPHPAMRFVEGVFEELDAPGEWFHDREAHMLYFFPPEGVDLPSAKTEVVVPVLESVVRFEGARHVTLSGVTIAHTARTFMKTREPLVRSDWRIYRGGAVFFENAEACAVTGCDFEAPGGNAVFVSNRNRDVKITACLIREAGASGVVFAGNPAAARSALFHYADTQEPGAMDREPGPRGDDFPRDCTVSDCLITRIGRVEKQSAGVSIDLAARITVAHCSIYEVPRAGINIGDGCWGGHVIEGNDVFGTVLETNDHGAFNSWGRDRFWERTRLRTAKWVAAGPDMPFWDAREPVVIRGNRFRCDHGWDIDLDDGSTNYVIENNLCLSGGIKLREGYRRIARNNITVDNGLHPHVWYPDSGDVVEANIFFAPAAPTGMPASWPGVAGANFLHGSGGGADGGADARFVAPAAGDYRVAADSPALARGFKNFPMDNFGVTSGRLRKIARTPPLPAAGGAADGSAGNTASRLVRWDGATVRSLASLADQSATGMLSATGVLVAHVGRNARLQRFGVMPRDVILRWGARPVADMAGLQAAVAAEPEPATMEVWRDQESLVLEAAIRNIRQTNRE